MRLTFPLRGQALVEFALVVPLFVLAFFSVITLGLYVFYNQQLENAAREAARYAVTHSSSAQCPTVSRLDPIGSIRPDSYYRCDAPEQGWPRMTETARAFVWGMNRNDVRLSACWSGLVDAFNNHDASPTDGVFRGCTISRVDPRARPDDIPCPPPATIDSAQNPEKADGDDKASSTAYTPTGRPPPGATPGPQHYPTTITVYTCFNWTPPMAGFLFLPSTITLRAVVTEALQRQQ